MSIFLIPFVIFVFLNECAKNIQSNKKIQEEFIALKINYFRNKKKSKNKTQNFFCFNLKKKIFFEVVKKNTNKNI